MPQPTARQCQQQCEIKDDFEELQEMIERVIEYLQSVSDVTEKILNQSSGVPRGKWAYCKGADRVASDIRAIVE